MHRVRVPLITLSMVLTIAACSRHDPVAKNASGAGLPPPANAAAADPTGAPPEDKTEPETAASPAAPAAAIPAALQGRWALSPADCMTTRSDRKGLLVVTADGLQFHDSSAVPTVDVEIDEGSISGQFHFTGQGRAWDRYEALQRNGGKLTRTENSPAASYTYAKC